mgnify:CR=1 FL=1
MLELRNVSTHYGKIQALHDVSVEVKEGEIVTLIGANGAGKTTTLKAVTGTQPAAEGSIQYLGRDIKGQGPWDLVKQGLVMVPEGRGTFTRMTITENLQMGAFVRKDTPEPVVQRLHKAITDTLADPAVRTGLDANSLLLAQPLPQPRAAEHRHHVVSGMAAVNSTGAMAQLRHAFRRDIGGRRPDGEKGTAGHGFRGCGL